MRNAIGLVTIVCVLVSGPWTVNVRAAGDEARYIQYTDPGRRFIFDYPSTMQVKSTGPDDVQVFHQAASFRISVFVERRKNRPDLTAEDLLTALKKALEKETKDFSVLGEGKLEGLPESQGYVVVSFRDTKGTQLVQLVQYYVAAKACLQMTISDRPWGFKNLEPVIKKVHRSLRIVDPTLQ
jgi:hypothetical protein